MLGAPASPPRESDVLRLRLVGGRASAEAAGVDALPGRSHYFIGRDPARWHTEVPHYARVRYRDVYPGVDLVYYGNEGGLEFDFLVGPGTDPPAIRMAVSGALGLEIDAGGDVVLRGAGGDVRLKTPHVYQETGSGRQTITGRYVLLAAEADEGRELPSIGFELGDYDSSRPLVIDPLLGYSSYLGGDDDDEGLDLAVDGAGNTYIVGTTRSADFPVANALQPAFMGGVCQNPLGQMFPCSDIFVSKLSADGTTLLFSTYLGGATSESGQGIDVDSQGNAYIAGATDSADFPTVHPFQAALAGGNCGTAFRCPDVIVAKLSPAGSALVFSTYLGGSGSDFGADIAVDAEGRAHVTGTTLAPDFPTVNAFQPTFGGVGFPGGDVFVTKLSPDGSSLVFSTYLGGNHGEDGAGVALGAGGEVYVVGSTRSPNFPVANAFDATYAGGNCGGPKFPIPCPDVFVAKLSPSGSSLVYSTYLGGDTDDVGRKIAVDRAGNAYVTGLTASPGFPVTPRAFQIRYAGFADAFVTKLAPSGSSLVYSTFLGGQGADHGFDLAVDRSGEVEVVGWTSSTDFPTEHPLQATWGGGVCPDPLFPFFTFPCPDVFVTRLNTQGSALVHSTYLGGSGNDHGRGVALDATGRVYIAGPTSSTNFPTASPFQAALAGGTDAFVARLTVGPEVVVRIASSGGARRLTVTVANGGAAEDVELKLWVEIPGFDPVSSVPVATSVFSLPPTPAVAIVSDAPIPDLPFPGTIIGARLLRPASGDVRSESLCAAVPCR